MTDEALDGVEGGCVFCGDYEDCVGIKAKAPIGPSPFLPTPRTRL